MSYKILFLISLLKIISINCAEQKAFINSDTENHSLKTAALIRHRLDTFLSVAPEDKRWVREKCPAVAESLEDSTKRKMEITKHIFSLIPRFVGNDHRRKEQLEQISIDLINSKVKE